MTTRLLKYDYWARRSPLPVGSEPIWFELEDIATKPGGLVALNDDLRGRLPSFNNLLEEMSMNDLEILSPVRLSSRVQEFVSETSDLYVDFLSQGRKSLAASLLSGLVVAVATLDRISDLPPGPERMRNLQHAARVFHRLSLLIFVSTIYDDENDGSELKTQHAYDTAADLSGLLKSAARRR